MLLPPDRRRSSLDWRVIRAYWAGTTAGAFATAAAAWVVSGFFSPFPAGARLGLLGAGALLVWMVKEGPLADRVALPEARRQIPAEVFGGGLTRGALRFGFEMGTGVRTYTPSIAPYVLLLGLVLARPTVAQALAVAAGFGLGRAVPLMVHASAADRDRLVDDALRGTIHRYSTATGLVVLIGVASLV